MKTPEKIYIERILCTNEVYDTWKSQKTITDDIEYTRTDAFIEKAAEWLRENLLVSDLGNHNYYVMDEDSKQLFIENFRNYMKGE